MLPPFPGLIVVYGDEVLEPLPDERMTSSPHETMGCGGMGVRDGLHLWSRPVLLFIMIARKGGSRKCQERRLCREREAILSERVQNGFLVHGGKYKVPASRLLFEQLIQLLSGLGGAVSSRLA